MRKKGKVHPFNSSSSSTPSSNSNTDSQSVLKLLPTAILTLVSFLSLEDREVLAYMITRSLNSTTPSFSHEDNKRTSNPKKLCAAAHNSPALFDCDCFHCYTSFWLRWDSSPNRELIHQAIEAFDDHLNSGDHLKNGKSKRRDKLGRRKTEKVSTDASVALASPPAESPGNHERAADVDEVEVVEEDSAAAEAAPVVVVETTHKGLVRKVLPDFMGIFHSRYWSLWSPNV